MQREGGRHLPCIQMVLLEANPQSFLGTSIPHSFPAPLCWLVGSITPTTSFSGLQHKPPPWDPLACSSLAGTMWENEGFERFTVTLKPRPLCRCSASYQGFSWYCSATCTGSLAWDSAPVTPALLNVSCLSTPCLHIPGAVLVHEANEKTRRRPWPPLQEDLDFSRGDAEHTN